MCGVVQPSSLASSHLPFPPPTKNTSRARAASHSAATAAAASWLAVCGSVLRGQLPPPLPASAEAAALSPVASVTVVAGGASFPPPSLVSDGNAQLWQIRTALT